MDVALRLEVIPFHLTTCDSDLNSKIMTNWPRDTISTFATNGPCTGTSPLPCNHCAVIGMTDRILSTA